jgi:hypothetical protein
MTTSPINEHRLIKLLEEKLKSEFDAHGIFVFNITFSTKSGGTYNRVCIERHGNHYIVRLFNHNGKVPQLQYLNCDLSLAFAKAIEKADGIFQCKECSKFFEGNSKLDDICISCVLNKVRIDCLYPTSNFECSICAKTRMNFMERKSYCKNIHASETVCVDCVKKLRKCPFCKESISLEDDEIDEDDEENEEDD